MDSVNYWKKILLQWITKCNFLENNFYSLDQTEIELFFMHFKGRFNGDVCQYNNLSSFLKEQYPLFEPHFDDENTLSSGDHIYVYSLLLHFSCVRCPVAFFQDNCQKLDELAQQNITDFFQKLLNEELLTKETLRHVIASIQVFTPPNYRLLFNTESPMKTPRKITDISPPTPRSCMLQEKNKKVYSLKAQLETLGYEKIVLETDLKNYQDKIDKLNKELKRSNQEIQDLKNDILSRSNENGDCVMRHTGEEQIRRLSKKIAQKEHEIAKQRETIEDLTEQKDCLNEKLKNAEKQMKVLQNNITDLSEKVDDLSQELEQKECTIQSLSDANSELEQYISGIRSSTVNSRPDLNMSSEFFDLSRATNSSGSIHSPENLGSVVDIKLREKENENEKLFEEISSIRIDNIKLSKAMSELLSRYSKLFDIYNENLIIDDEESLSNPANYFITFSNCIESFSKKYEENLFALNRIKADAKQIEEQNLSQANKLVNIQIQNNDLKKENEELHTVNKSLQISKTSLENAISELENKLENCFKERAEEKNNLKNLQKELECLKTEKLDVEHNFQQQMENLTSCLETKENLLTKLQLDNENKAQLINENQQRSEELYQEKQCCEKKISDLKVAENELLEQLDHEKSKTSEFEKQTTYLSRELEKSKQNYDTELKEQKYLNENNKQQIDLLQQQIQTLSDDQNLKASTILKLETEKETLINKYENIFKQETNKFTELKKKLLHTEAELNSRQNELQKVAFQLETRNEVFSKVITYILHDVTDLKHQLGIEINITSIQNLLVSSYIEPLDIKLKEEVKCLIDDISSIKNACGNVVKENSSLRQKLSELEKKTENFRDEKSSLEKNVSHLESERLKQISITENLIKSETNLRDQIKMMTSSAEKLETEILNKTKDVEMLLEKQIQAEQLAKELQEQIVKIETVSNLANVETKERDRELENAKIQLENEITEKIKIKEQLQETTETITQLQLKISSLENQLAGMEEEASKTSSVLSREFERTKIQLENEVTAKQQMKKEFEDVRIQFENIKLHLETEKTEKLNNQQVQIEATQKQQEELQNITLQLETEISKTKSLIKDLADTNIQLENEVKNKHQLKKELEETKSRLENEISTLKINLEKSQHELEEEVMEKSKMTKDFESTKHQLEIEVTEKNQIEENLKETNLNLECKLAENQQIKEELDNIKLQLARKVNEIRKAKEDIANAYKSMDELQLKVTDLENKYETEKKLKENTKVELENEAVAKTEMKDKLEKANKDLKELQTKIVNLEAKNAAINQKADEYNRQLEDVKQQIKNEAAEKSSITEAFENANKQLNELTNAKLVLEKKYQVLITEADKHRSEIKRYQYEETRLLEELELLKTTSESQIKKSNKEAEEQKENVSRLIQEIASIRKEKELAEEEKKILSKRLDCYLNEKTSKETNHRWVEEKLQVAEKEILVKLNLLKTEQLKSQDLENQLKKLQIENAKLRETASSNMKRIEKQALTLGECQAKCQKLKKDTEIAQNNSEMLKSSMEMVQRENSRLNQEYKSLKEKLSKCEKSKDQFESRAQTLQKEIEKFTEEIKILETSENELKISNSSLEKIKHNLEDKIRKLAKSLSDSNVALSKVEQDKVQLNLEVGGLNKQLQENKTLLNMKLIEIETLTSNLMDAKNTNSRLVELNEKHQSQANEIEEENSRLNDQLSKLSLRLKITQEGHETTRAELENLKTAIEASKLERDAIEKDHRKAVERLLGIEGLVEERRSTEVEFANKIKSLEEQISKLSTDKSNLEELRNKDKLMIEQLNEDIMIFKAKLQKSRGICEENEKKWAEEKESLSAEVKESQDRIKETRLELEGKLEKMKNKMKTLYNDEVTKMKKKQEREVAVFKTDIDSLKAKNEKHEAHIKKLSSQIFRLNENILEFQKENTFLKTKLRDLENKPHQLGRNRATSSSSTSAHQVLSSNLRMEDEEGEIFNNTYLSDLKDGRMSEYFNNDICAQELQYRNSQLPPHLKSTYLAQFDHQMGEDEIRDTPTLDDSSSTLLNTGQRKKVSGATSYKRPGPPTPSKNAGRLSFGGMGELNREILKESLDMASCSSSSSKTPAKFKFFSSKLSMKGDERKSYVTNFKKKLLSGGTIQCSSTPRKSKAHIDQRRLLDQIMCTASPGPEFSPDCIVKPAVNLPSSLKKLELNRRMSVHKWRQPKLSYASDSGTSDVNSPQMKDVRYVSSGAKKRTKRSKDRRGSIYLRGSMFARNCRTPTMGFREVFKNKLKAQRNANFNKYRHEGLNEMLVKKTSLCSNNNWDDETCNNNNDDFFLEELDMKKHVIEDGNSFGGDDNVNNDETSKHFQQLLAAKESNAPFEISEINSNPSYYNVNNSSSNVHSRIIYGASVILNRKIPNVSTTMVRKSSIYVKGNDGKSVILVTNQTITLKDLAQMWLQMNVSAKTFIAFSFTATLIGIVSFVIQFIHR